MKARFVNEQNFERRQDPLTSMGIGREDIRNIRKNYNYLEPYLKTMEGEPDLDFKDFRNRVDSLRDILQFIIINHINKKYGIGVAPTELDKEWSQTKFAIAEGNNWHLSLWKNGPGNAFWFKLYHDGEQTESKQSSILRTFDAKLGKALKKAGII